jgi:hypothetical protein
MGRICQAQIENIGGVAHGSWVAAPADLYFGGWRRELLTEKGFSMVARVGRWSTMVAGRRSSEGMRLMGRGGG